MHSNNVYIAHFVDCINFRPNSYRVMTAQAETIQPPAPISTYSATMANINVIGQDLADDARPIIDYRHNRPNPLHVGFLSQNVALLNEPICDVYTAITRPEQHRWWPHRTSNDPLKVSEHTLDTTARADFQYRGENEINTRHSSNPNKEPALGSGKIFDLHN